MLGKLEENAILQLSHQLQKKEIRNLKIRNWQEGNKIHCGTTSKKSKAWRQLEKAKDWYCIVYGDAYSNLLLGSSGYSALSGPTGLVLTVIWITSVRLAKINACP